MTDLAVRPTGYAQIIDLVEHCRRDLAEAKTVWEARVIRERAAAIKELATRQERLEDPQVVRSHALATRMDAAELWIDAYRVEGLLLREMQDAGERHPQGGDMAKSHDVISLPDLGYAHGQEAKRAIDVSVIYEEVVGEYKSRQRDKSEPGTMAGLIRYWADWLKQRNAVAMPLPTGVFRTLVIDPPWPMGKSARVETPEQGSTLDYPTMSLDEIAALPIAEHAADDAHLYLWVTQRFLPDGLALVEEWGFKYHCLLTWLKPGGFAPFSWMFNTEHVVFAYRGQFELRELGLNIGFQAPRGAHSEKPEAFYDMVERASFEPWVELFARRGRANWTVWGDEM
jgi:Transcriptional activator, adenine-specific DNA methyltransferase